MSSHLGPPLLQCGMTRPPCGSSASRPSTTTPPPAWCRTAASSPRRRRSASRASATTTRWPAAGDRVLPRATPASRRDDLDLVAFYDKPLLEVRAPAVDLRGVGAGGAALVLARDAAVAQAEAVDPRSDPQGATGLRQADIVSRAPRIARGERVLPLALRRGGHPHRRRRGRMDDDLARRRPRQSHRAAIRKSNFPHSLGLLYSAFTYYTGFKVNCGEYKVMGLAPYGEPRYAEVIYDKLIDLRDDGSFRLDLDYFDYCAGPDHDQPALRRASSAGRRARPSRRCRSARWTWRRRCRRCARRRCCASAATRTRRPA